MVGKDTPIAVKAAFQVIALAEPSSRNLKVNLLPSTGVPLGALIVIALAKAVTLYWSAVWIFGVMDVGEAAVDTLGLIRALVIAAVAATTRPVAVNRACSVPPPA